MSRHDAILCGSSCFGYSGSYNYTRYTWNRTRQSLQSSWPWSNNPAPQKCLNKQVIRIVVFFIECFKPNSISLKEIIGLIPGMVTNHVFTQCVSCGAYFAAHFTDYPRVIRYVISFNMPANTLLGSTHVATFNTSVLVHTNSQYLGLNHHVKGLVSWKDESTFISWYLDGIWSHASSTTLLWGIFWHRWGSWERSQLNA